MNNFLNQLLEQRNTMSLHLSKFFVSGALVVMMAAGARAQVSQQPDAGQTGDGVAVGSVCGTFIFDDGKQSDALAATAQHNPDLYRHILQRAKESAPRSMQSSDDGVVLGFLMRNRVTGQFDEVSAKLVYQGRRARIWVDVVDTSRIKLATINLLAKGLDSITTGKSRDVQKSIIDNDEAVFGAPPLNHFDNSNICDFLLTDIKDNVNGGFVAGFFSPYDQTDAPGSNKMNLLYIDSREGLGNQSTGNISNVLGTLAHEYQHLIHYNTNNQSETFFNEGCSEVASILNGYQTRGNSGFAGNTNYSLFAWDFDDAQGAKILADYERAMTFVHYLNEQYGEQFITVFNKTKSRGMDRIADALKATGHSDDWKNIVSAWVVANYLKTFTQPYGYKNKLSGNVPTLSMNVTTAGSFPDTGSATVQQYASIYNSYTKPGPFRITFHASLPMRAMAMLYKGNTAVEVWQLERDSTYLIGGNGTTYDKVVFGVVNLYSNAQTIRWNMGSVTLGVDGRSAAASVLAVNSIAPNPANGPVTVGFSTANAGATTVELYDSRGALVRTLVNGERYEAGEHQLSFDTEGMAMGAYMVRVSQGNRNASQVMVVVR